MLEHLINYLHLDVNELDHDMGGHREGTPLHYAARRNNIGAARPLLKHGADPTIRCRNWTPARLAEQYKFVKLAQLRRESERITKRHRKKVALQDQRRQHCLL
jgi:ankyrin repeat protein